MIEYDVLSYNGQKQVYEIEEGGLNLLSMIKKESAQGKVTIKDITITFEQRTYENNLRKMENMKISTMKI